MTTIRILPEILSNQIAAGEVVQRPANAVKELVENSIDAGATSITIEIEKGGKSLIRISDNGIGLSRDDALLAIERYATSKIYKTDDLFSISTMGFRGEALPSIASVSRFVMITRTGDSDVGTRIEINGGKLTNVADEGSPVGTMVEVRRLLYNTPARKKFLKSDSTEVSHIADAVWGIALGHPHIQFRLFINGRLQKSVSENEDLFQRSVNILGRDVAGKLYSVDFSEDDLRIHGFCANPQVTRSTSSKIYLFVNHRLVTDRGLVSAVFKGYKGRIMKGRFPMGVFFIDIPFDQVDVNVHPSKKEIKFFNAGRVYHAMALAVRESMARAQQDMAGYARTSPAPEPLAVPERALSDIPSKQHPPPKKVESFAYYDEDLSPPSPLKVEQAAISFSPISQPGENEKSPTRDVFVRKDDLPEKAQSDVLPDVLTDVLADEQTVVDPGLTSQDENACTAKIRVVGQALGTYILAEAEGGLMLIDQHAAHERILYEKLKRRHQSLKSQSQNLAVPETLDLGFKEADFLTGILDELRELGLVVEPFGGNTFVIKAVPVLMDSKEVKPLLIEIIESALVKKEGFSNADWLEENLILMACHSAVRANLSLSETEMQKMVADLEKCENSRHCPHGRPIMIFWDRARIEKLFKRVV